MSDIGTSLIVLMLGASLLLSQLPLDRSRPAARRAIRLGGLVLLCLWLAIVGMDIAGVTPQAPLSRTARTVIAGLMIAMLAVSLFFYIRADARRLREKKATRQAQ